MIPKNVDEQITLIAKKFPEIKEVLLFGSRAYGDHGDRSDIDLVVIAPHMSPSEWLSFTGSIEDELETLLKVDLVRWETASPELQHEIKKCYKKLFPLS